MNDKYDQYILKLLEENKGENIVFWGASLFLQNFISKNDLSNYNIIGIIDTNSSKQNTMIDKYRIYSSEDILDKANKIIFTIKNNHRLNFSTVLKEVEVTNQKNKLLANPFEMVEAMPMISNKIYVLNALGEKFQVSRLPNLEVDWWGTNATIEIDMQTASVIKNCHIICRTNSYVRIKATPHYIKNLNIVLEEDSSVIIGENFSIESGDFYVNCDTGNTLTIGDNCMFSRNVVVRTTDGHCICDRKTRKCINHAQDITIGNNVWIGQSVTILKKGSINEGCVVGSNSVVTKTFTEKNILIAGYPAKVIKRNIIWNRKTASQYMDEAECEHRTAISL